jgi:hypothetical protein
MSPENIPILKIRAMADRHQDIIGMSIEIVLCPQNSFPFLGILEKCLMVVGNRFVF